MLIKVIINKIIEQKFTRDRDFYKTNSQVIYTKVTTPVLWISCVYNDQNLVKQHTTT